MGDGSAASAIKYLDYLIEKGRASNGAINPLKIAFTKVMQTIDGNDTWVNSQVRNVDVDDYMHRFANLTLGKYSADSLTVYKSRVKKVVEWYIKFLDTPGWTPEIQRRNRSGMGSKAGAVTAATPTVSLVMADARNSHRPGDPTGELAGAISSDRETPLLASPSSTPAGSLPGTAAVSTAPEAVPANPQRVVYPFPLSDGQLVHISLPFNLGKSDAKRIGAFVESIARDDA